ncbi:jg21480 [Pararge aegeria aegeria]|uniref:Jg21480 protein n=1 Tax=Pararge aegeria aegeria TaxID=348720 RepID=A0A8S4RRI7_9NEOP|nr:jg21480 [Pararge aegeria aegeria]
MRVTKNRHPEISYKSGGLHPGRGDQTAGGQGDRLRKRRTILDESSNNTFCILPVSCHGTPVALDDTI